LIIFFIEFIVLSKYYLIFAVLSEVNVFSKIINLTLGLVIHEVKDILNYYPEYPYQVAFSNQELRQKLITYILNRFPNYYAILEDGQDPPKDPRFLYASLEEQVQLEVLICNSIVDVFQANADSIGCHISQEETLDNNPSHRFD
jgi:hypothetical protein